MSKTNLGLVEFVLSKVGCGYIFGATGQVITEALIQQFAAGDPIQYSSEYIVRSRRWIGHESYDCAGIIDAYCEIDTTADNYFLRATIKGNSIINFPKTLGALVHMSGHVGVYIGNNQVVEARGVDYGVVITALSARPWVRWSQCYLIDYISVEVIPPPVVVVVPAPIPTAYWKNVGCGAWHSMAVNSNGILYSTGYDYYGQLGLGNVLSATETWTEVMGSNSWEKILACGTTTSFAQRTDKTVYATGDNRYGQLGIGNYTNQSNFTIINGMTFSQLSAGGFHTVGISNGKLYATGRNNYGQLGLGDSNNRNSFTQIGLDNDWIEVRAGYEFTIALKKNGTLWGCGNNNFGSFGYSYSFSQENNIWNYLVPLSQNNLYSSIYAGYFHSLAIRKDGAICGTGVNQFGELGIVNESIWYNGFRPISITHDWKNVFAGDRNSFIIKENGSVYVSGENTYGELGFPNDTTSKFTFTDNPNINVPII